MENSPELTGMLVIGLGKVYKRLDKLHYVVPSRPPINASFFPSSWKVSAYDLEFNIVNTVFSDFLLFSHTFLLYLWLCV